MPFSPIWKDQGLTKKEKESMVQVARFTASPETKPRVYKSNPSKQPFINPKARAAQKKLDAELNRS